MVASNFANGASEDDKEVVCGVRVSGDSSFYCIVVSRLCAIFAVEDMVKLVFELVAQY